MISNEKVINYKVLDLVNPYNFDIKFTSSEISWKSINLFALDHL
jgi:hypothetical protein